MGERSKGVGFGMKVINLALSTFESKVLMGHSDDEIWVVGQSELKFERVIKTRKCEVGSCS